MHIKLTISKIISIFVNFLLVFYSIAPAVYAQEATPAPSSTPIVQETATAEPTISPSPSPTVAPTASPEVSPSPSLSLSPSPTPQVSPNPPPAGGKLTAVILPDTSATSVTSLDLDPVEVTSSASLITDKADYAPTDTVVISGTGLKPNTTYILVISSTDAPAVNFQTDVKTDDKGGFVYAYQLDGVYRPNYKVELKDSSGNIVATTSFTDSYTGGGNIDLYSQCENDDGDGYATGDTGCRWTNGNLNSSNSTYHEDDATVQRLAIDDLTNGDHTVIIKYSTTKGSKHTYDFMTDDDFSELAPNPLTNADLCDPAITNLDSCATLTPVLSGLIPTDTNAAGHDVDRSARHFKIRNGTWVGSGIPSGPTLIEGTYAGDSETIITLNFNVNTATCVNQYTKQGTDVCEVLITWGAHVSSQADWGTGNSAVNVSGSPYHVQIADVDGTATQGGGRDNQMAASAIVLPTTLTVNKICVPSDDTGKFNLKIDGTTAGTGADASCGGTTGVITVTAASHTVSETAGTGTNLSNYTSVIGGDCAADGTITLATSDAKICTITNTRKPRLTVNKILSPSDDTGKFNLFINGTQYATDVSNGGTTNAQFANIGSNTFAEAAGTGTNLSDYTSVVSGASCGGTATAGTITLAAGDDKTCTITNTRNQGTIELNKVWSGTAGQTTLNIGTTAGASDVDTQLTGASGAVPLTTGTNTVNTGTYFVSETGGLTNYGTSLACTDNGSPVTPGTNNSLSVTTGHVVICTFTNTRNTGKIELQKDFVGTPENVTIKIGTAQNGSEVDSDVLSADGTDGEHTVDTGTYFVSEVLTTPANYTTSLSCYNDVNDNDAVDGGDTVHAVNTGTGETAVGSSDDVLCIYTNTRHTGTVELRKHWVGTAGNTSLTIGSTVGGNEVDTQVVSGSDDTTGQNTVDTGTYYANETAITGYDSAPLSCFNDANNNGTNDSESVVTVGASNAVDVATGQHVVCSFTNTEHGHIIVDKVAFPSADSQSFDFTAGGTGYSNFSLTDVATPNDQEVSAGAYSVSESAVLGWDSDGGVCDKGETPASLDVEPGETVTCTFTNTKQGKITIVKNATPNDAQDFEFSFTGKDNFFLDDDAGVQNPPSTDYPQSQTFDNLSANTDYTAGEILPAFWQFQGVTCVNADQTPYTNIAVTGTSVEITLNPGAQVTCTFNNFKPGPTRTQGFWQTHTAFTSQVFASTPLNGLMGIGATPHKGTITNTQSTGQSQLFGAYYSNVSMKSTGKGKAAQRLPVDQARMVLLQQLVTAKLNCTAFGCSSTILSNITAADLAYFLENIAGMQIYTGILDVYNNSGDTIIISPPLPAPGKATPKTSQSFANIVFWDSP